MSFFEYLSTRAPLPAAARTETALRLALSGPAARPASAEQFAEKAAMCAAIVSFKHAAQDAGTGGMQQRTPCSTLLGFLGPIYAGQQKQETGGRIGQTLSGP